MVRLQFFVFTQLNVLRPYIWCSTKLAFLATVFSLDCSLSEGVKLITSNLQIASRWNIIKSNSSRWMVSMLFKTLLSTQNINNTLSDSLNPLIYLERRHSWKWVLIFQRLLKILTPTCRKKAIKKDFPARLFFSRDTKVVCRKRQRRRQQQSFSCLALI